MKVFKKILYMWLIPLMLVTKVIEIPFAINFSPADLLMLFIGPLLIIDFIKDERWRNELLKSNIVRVFFLLVLIRALSSVFSFFIDVERLTLIGMFVSNLKFIMSFFYFLSGLKAIEVLGKSRILAVGYASAYLFLTIGLASTFLFNTDLLGLERMVSLANDPNVAGLVCLFGILLGGKWVAIQKNIYYKTIILISLIPFGLGIIMTGSRTAVGAAVLLCLFMLFQFRHTPKKLVIILTLLVLVVNLTLIIETQVFESKNIDSFISRMYFELDSSSDFRNSLGRMATEMGNDYWLLGIGTGHYPINSEKYLLKFHEDFSGEKLVTHNTFLSFYAENGVLGFIGYSVLLGLFFKKSKGSFARAYLVLVVIYSLYFNIENIRAVWFLFGVWLCFDEDPKGQELSMSWKYIGGATLICVISTVLFMPTLIIPFNLDGKSIDITVEKELELYMELSNPYKSTFKVSINGETKKTHTIKNELGFFYDCYVLAPGDYSISFDVDGGDIIVNRMILTSDQAYDVVRGLPFKDKMRVITSKKKPLLTRIPLVTRKYDIGKAFPKGLIAYENNVKSINFGDEIQLLSSNLHYIGESEYLLSLEFQKIGEVSADYSYRFGGHSASVENFDRVSTLNYVYDFKPSIMELSVGEKFSAQWKFNTAGESFYLYSGFFTVDPKSGQEIQPWPRFINHGFVK